MPDDQKPPEQPRAEVTEDTFRQWFERYEKERNPIPASSGDQQPKGANTPDIAAAVEAALSRREANSKRESRLSALEQSNTELSAQVKALTDQIKKAGRSVFSIFN